MPPNADEHDGNTLVPLKQFGSASETDIVIGLLRSSGIPAVHAAQCVATAYRLIADMGDVAPSSIPIAGQFADEPRSIFWDLAGGVLIVIGLWLGWLRWFGN